MLLTKARALGPRLALPRPHEHCRSELPFFRQTPLGQTPPSPACPSATRGPEESPSLHRHPIPFRELPSTPVNPTPVASTTLVSATGLRLRYTQTHAALAA